MNRAAYRPAAAALALLLVSAVGGRAQEPGDSIRVRSPSVVEFGRFVEWTPDGVRLQNALGDRRLVPVPEDGRVEVWRRNDVARDLFLAGSLSFVGGLLLYDEDRALTSTRLGDAVITGGLGLAIGVVFQAIKPGGWKRATPP